MAEMEAVVVDKPRHPSPFSIDSLLGPDPRSPPVSPRLTWDPATHQVAWGQAATPAARGEPGERCTPPETHTPSGGLSRPPSGGPSQSVYPQPSFGQLGSLPQQYTDPHYTALYRQQFHYDQSLSYCVDVNQHHFQHYQSNMYEQNPARHQNQSEDHKGHHYQVASAFTGSHQDSHHGHHQAPPPPPPQRGQAYPQTPLSDLQLQLQSQHYDRLSPPFTTHRPPSSSLGQHTTRETVGQDTVSPHQTTTDTTREAVGQETVSPKHAPREAGAQDTVSPEHTTREDMAQNTASLAPGAPPTDSSIASDALTLRKRSFDEMEGSEYSRQNEIVTSEHPSPTENRDTGNYN